MTATVFLDRDGTLNREVHFLRSPDQIEVLPGVVPALHRLAAHGYRMVVTTNQSGVARGLLTERDLAHIHAALHERLDRLPLAYLHCPHHPTDGDAAGYVRTCRCRKPAPGMLHEAVRLLGPFGVGFAGSAVIGDSARDLLMADGLPLRRILVQSGKPVAEQRARLEASGCPADHEATDLADAVDWLLRAGCSGPAVGR